MYLLALCDEGCNALVNVLQWQMHHYKNITAKWKSILDKKNVKSQFLSSLCKSI